MKPVFRILLSALILALFALAASAKELAWNFDRDYDDEGWVKTNCVGDVKGGSFDLTATTNGAGNYDPFVSHPLDDPAKEYPYLVLCMKWENERVLENTTSIYFQTDGANLSESTRVTNPTVEGKTTEGKYLVQVFDMTTNPNWKGTLKRVRIDAINAAGTFSINYIKLTDTLPDAYDVITGGSSSGPSAASGKGFEAVRAYADGFFRDVTPNDWFAPYVADAYALGFMGGKGDGVFDPEGDITTAEAVTVAARMHALYHEKDEAFAVGSGEWYAPYVAYATANGLIAADTFDSYERPIRRGEMAALFCGTLPVKHYAPVNVVGYVPDLPLDAPYREAVLVLYNAGVVMGSDAYGTFTPENNITRAEAAAIIGRAALPEKRVKGALLPPSRPAKKTPTGEGYYLIDNATLIYGTAVQSAFDFNIAGTKNTVPANVTNVLDDNRDNAGTFMKRAVNTETDGVLAFAFRYKLGYDPDGVYIAVRDAANRDVFRLFTENAKYYLAKGASAVPLGIAASLGNEMWLEGEIDLDEKTVTLYLNTAYLGVYPFASDATDVSSFVYGTTERGTPMINALSLFMTKNYLVRDDFFAGTGHTFTASGSVEKKGDELTASGTFGASFPFAPYGGRVAFETLFFAESTAGTVTLRLSDETGNGLAVPVTGGKLFGKDVASGLWHILRIEADPAAGKAVIKLDGKQAGETAFTAKTFCAASLDGENAGSVKFDELYVTPLIDYADYVPAPVPAESEYILGINVCSIWREGNHRGWGVISPYDELSPILGYYDEGSPEAADWEIKWMAEHGIDYQMLCWYGNARGGAVKLGRNSAAAALHEGYFNAKYAGTVKYAIMWENTTNTPSLENFKKHILPYWAAYYFTDPHYMTVDNKPVVSIWSVGALVSAMGADGAKEAVADIRDCCKTLGFDDALVLVADGHSTRPDQFRALASVGADATYAYHWNDGGVKSYHQITRMTNYLNYNASDAVPSEEKIKLVPTVSVGFNSIGWKGKRTGLINDEEYGKVADFIKSDVLPTLAGTPMANMVMISTWNEYGEGTYIAPSVGLGFEYLDNVRKNFTASAAHEDVFPTGAQKARVGKLYPQNRHLLSPLYEADVSEYPQTVRVSLKLTDENLSSFNLFSQNGGFINERGNYEAASSGNTIIFPKEAMDVNIDDCDYVRVTMRAQKDIDTDVLTAYLFFATDDYPNVEEPTRTAFQIPNGGDMATYYVKMSGNNRWRGNLKTLRLDPTNGGSFELDSIEILQNDPKFPILVDGKALQTYGVPQHDGGSVLIPAHPAYGTFTVLGADYDWNKSAGILTVNGHGHTVVFTVGSKEALVDGEKQTLDTAVTLFDGLPLIPYDFLASSLGCMTSLTGENLTIVTDFAG